MFGYLLCRPVIFLYYMPCIALLPASYAVISSLSHHGAAAPSVLLVNKQPCLSEAERGMPVNPVRRAGCRRGRTPMRSTPSPTDSYLSASAKTGAGHQLPANIA